MANYERRSSDKDEMHVFDGGEDDQESEGSHLPVVIIIAILVLAAFGGVVWLAYNQGVARGRSDVPMHVAGNDTNAGGQIKVYQQPAGAEEGETAPAPNPMPRAQSVSPESETPLTAETQTPPPQALTPVKPQPAPPPPTVAKPAPAQLAMAKPTQQTAAATHTPPAVATKPPAQLSISKPAQGQGATTTYTPAASKPVATLKPSTAAGSYALQVGAYKSQDEAMAAWKTYQAKHAALLAGFSPDVQRADLGPKGVWFRLRVVSFADKTAATALCERLKAENGSCFLAR